MSPDFSTLKAGDKVILLSGYDRTGSVETVERVTPTQILLAGTVPRRFSRKDGKRMAYTGYHIPRIETATPERIAEVQTAREKAHCVERLRSFTKWDAFSIETLRNLCHIIGTS